MLNSSCTHTLTIVIPAFNEEEAIGGTVSACLEAVEQIKHESGIADVELIVVSDGSTDRTAEIVRGFPDVKLIEFEANRGYGAALMEGFGQGSGSLVSFLDADGTCDPRVFGELARVAIEENADVVLGSRLGPESRMPRVRRIGNQAFALLLGFLCGKSITDTASGMRVIRRQALDWLYPLPTGLHFTPSMSARALLGGMRLVEVPMPYAERIGQSKLRIVSDGIRFTRVILHDVLCYRPERLFLMAFTACLVAAVSLAVYPVEYYAAHRSVEEWMIYRFLVCGLLGSAGYQLLVGTALAHRMARFGPQRHISDSFWPAMVARLFEGWPITTFVALMTIVSFAVLWPGLVEYAM
ncbi:MAG: glycosyltransferase family 2 protein, partial [Thermoguttaceae bacterium]